MLGALGAGFTKLQKFNLPFYLLFILFAPVVDVLALLAPELY